MRMKHPDFWRGSSTLIFGEDWEHLPYVYSLLSLFLSLGRLFFGEDKAPCFLATISPLCAWRVLFGEKCHPTNITSVYLVMVKVFINYILTIF